jgi:hypothetical protein
MKRDIAALLAFIDARQNTPYEWGRDKNDCVGFALGAVEAMTGKRPARSLKWATEKTGLKLIAKLGGLEAAFDKHFKRIPPAKAMRGDIGGVPDEILGIHPMIVEGEDLVCPGDKGNRRCKRKHMTIAWSATDE